ncbi:MAG TPA: serine hydrolase [Candidatus Polarisedimenticolaceae bacterium]|nr:serine hydrolase [Candidatus Polarisedimenticolaceae bacterium]
MRALRLLLSCGLLLPSATAAAAEDLSGLWRAQRGPGAMEHARLLVTRSEEGYRADILGSSVAMEVHGNALTFTLPGDRGAFHGRLESGGIVGHWLHAGAAYPVRLSAQGPGRWSGRVTTGVDQHTFFLLLRPDGPSAWSAVLRNPERDFGSLWGVSKLVPTSGGVALLGQLGGKETVVGEGSFDAARDRITLSLAGRGAFEFSREGDESPFYARGRQPQKYGYRAPPALDDGWPTSSLAAAEIDQPAVERAIQGILETPMDSADAPQYHAVLVARHGKLVLEEYFHGAHRDRLHNIRSAGKSVTSILVGAVMQAGAPLRLTSPVYQVMHDGAFPRDLDAGKRGMTLEHLLTMSSGYFCDDADAQAPGNEDRIWDAQEEHPDFYRFTLQLPLASPPGAKAVYCSMQANLALGMVGRAAKDSPLHLFDRLIARPMQLGTYAWPLDPAGNPYGGGGLNLLARDFLKFGQLMLDGGVWKGRRILSRDFAHRSLASHYRLRRIAYGYLWWIEDLPYKDRTVRAFLALGNGGNNIVGIPELDLVVAIYGANYGSRTTGRIREIVPRAILPAVREPGDDRNAPVVEHAYTNPYGRSDDGGPVLPRPPR